MKKWFVGFLFFAGMISSSWADTSAVIDQADKIYAVRTETSGGQEALTLYEQVLSSEPTNATALWKAGRACYWIAENAKNKKEKMAAFDKGIAYTLKATELDPKSIDSHFWLAGLWGSYGEAKGVLKSLALVKPIRKELETINRLNDQYQGGAGYRILGIVDYKVPGFAGGSKKRAVEELNKAMAIDPNNAFNRYYMAEFLGTAMGKKKEAIEHLDVLKSLSASTDVDLPDLKRIQAKGERLRVQIGT